ncbi:glutathione S-transferase [Xylariaceae sp. FL0016]|nr:glutathione S-transferase [Xylariaceae sp. FL0016]
MGQISLWVRAKEDEDRERRALIPCPQIDSSWRFTLFEARCTSSLVTSFAMSLIVHHLGLSQSERVVWACEELQIPYQLKTYARSPLFAPREYKALHPLESSPVIEDANGFKLAESGACVEYICQTYGEGNLIIKPGDKGYSDYLYWFHFANGTFTPNLVHNMLLESMGRTTDNELSERFASRSRQILKFVDWRLSSVPYLAGEEFTAADIMNICNLTGLRCFAPYSLAGYPNILAYLARIGRREGYRRAMEKGDPDLDIKQLMGAAPPPKQKALPAKL